jgi:chemosensory pili system protein ChpA (sensor histidine kinase/response regulator)
MSNIGIVESGTLEWVKREIDQTLESSLEDIESFSNNPADTTPLRLFANNIHQVAGTLKMVELDGAAMIAREAELLADSLVGGFGSMAGEPLQSVVPLLDSSLRYLSEHLKRLQRGKVDPLVMNLEQINRLRHARGKEPLDVFSVFDPDLEVVPPKIPGQHSNDDTAYRERARGIRRTFLKSLLKWLKSSDVEALHVMTALTRELQALACFSNVAQVWWIASAHAEMMALNPENEGVAHKHVPARLDQLLRKLIEHGEASLVKDRDETLIREMLYDIGSSSCNSKLLTEVRQAFDLQRMLGGEVDAGEQKFASIPPDMGEELKQEINAVKADTVRYFGSRSPGNNQRQRIKAGLDAAMRQLRNYGLNDLVDLLDQAGNAVDLAESEQFGSDLHQAAAFNVAEALLFLEETLNREQALDQEWLDALNEKIERIRALDDTVDPDGKPGRSGIAHPSAADVKRILPRVVGEMYICLEAAGESLEAFASGNDEPVDLNGSAENLSQVQGALQMLGQYKAADMLTLAKEYIEKIVTGEVQPTDKLIESLAVAVGSAEAYIDGLENDRQSIHDVVDRAVQGLEDALALEELEEIDPAESASALERHLERWLKDSSDHEAFSQLRRKLGEMATIARASGRTRAHDIARELNKLFDLVAGNPASMSADIETTLRRSLTALAELLPDLTVPSSNTGIDAAPGADLQAGVDPDIQEIYREEAAECLAEVRNLMQMMRGDEPGRPMVSDLKRQFHTLKGSGRTVGATGVAELSWIVEQLLDDLLDSDLDVTAEVLAFMDDATTAVSENIDAPDFGTAALDLEQWSVRSGRILRSRTVADDPGDVPEEAVLDDTVIRIFAQETLGHIGTIRNLLGPEMIPISPELQRAVHTLGGTSRSLHLVEMSNLYHSLDKRFSSTQNTSGVLTTVQAGVLDKAAILSAQVLDRLNTDRTFPAALREGFDKLLGELEDDGGFEAGASPEDAITGIAGIGLLGKLVGGKRGPGDRLAVTPDEDPADDMGDLRAVFLDESTDILERLNKEIEAWPSSTDPGRSVASIKRDLHTLKGSAYAAGFGVMGDLGHQTETLLEQFDEGLEIKGDEFRFLLEEANDSLLEMVSQIRCGAPVLEPLHLKNRLSALIAKGAAVEFPVEQTEIGHRTLETDVGTALYPAEDPDYRSGHELLRINSGMLDNLVNYAGELSITRAQLQEHLGSLRSNLGELRDNVGRFGEQLRQLEIQADSQIRSRMSEPVQEPEDKAVRSKEFDPLQMDRYTMLQQLTRGLSESLDDLTTIQTGIIRYVHESESVLQQQARLGVELQDGLMSTRLVPFSSILSRLRHQARLWARELAKEVDLRMTGGDVEIDREVLDGISEALDHMVRNSVDHGIEPPADRERNLKQSAGSIIIECRQRGNEIVVRFGDDGRGLDIESIEEKAIARGLKQPGEPLSEQQVLQLIVLPGFTTATEVTQVSGRGVGMDVVHDAVRRLGGSIVVDSKPGKGTVFEISLPVSLSITQAVFVRCGRQEFAIPLNFVQGVMKADTGKILPSADRRPLFEKNGEIYPLLDLPGYFDLARDAGNEQRPAILIVRMGATEIAVKVTELLGSQEVVVKTLGSHISGVEGIAGATIRGDGRVIVILDLAGLWIADERHAETETIGPEADGSSPLVMVVDDSLTVCKVTSRNLSRHGMDVVMARDGIDALEQIAKRRPDLMLVDIEMPRMDGYELTGRVRGDPLTRNIPIVIITSRAGIKHQEKAMSLGADDYLIKPYQEEELVVHVERCLAAYEFRRPQR